MQLNKSRLTVVSDEPMLPRTKPRADAEARRRALLARRRTELLALAVAYVREGRDGTPQDRLRTASDLAGIPINLIEVELKR